MNSKYNWKCEIRDMNVLIVAATDFEIEPFKQQNKKTDTLVTGVGIPATIYHLTKKLLAKNYELVIQAGIAGTFAETGSLAEVVAVKEDCFADIGIEEKGTLSTLFDNGFIKENDFPFSDGMLVNPSPVLENIFLPKVRAITVNTITDNNFRNQKMEEKFSAQIETMEGAAFHYVCLHQKINFIQLRSISNKVGERNKSNWELQSSIANLNKELIKIIDHL